MPFPCTICIRNKKACAVTIAVIIVYLLNQIDDNTEYVTTSKIIHRGFCWKRDGCSDGVDFLVRSGKGRNEPPVVCVNGTVYMSDETKNFKRGLNLVIFQLVRHTKHGHVGNSSEAYEDRLVFRAARTFDTFESDGELLRFLKYSMDESFVLFGASYDEMSSKLGEDARHILENCGLRNVSHLEHRDAYAFVAQPGLQTGAAIESLSKRLMKAKRDAPAYAERASVSGCARFPLGALQEFRIDRPVVYIAPRSDEPLSMRINANDSLVETLANETHERPKKERSSLGFVDEHEQVQPFEFKTAANAVWYVQKLRVGEFLEGCGAAKSCPDGTVTVKVHSGLENKRMPWVCVDGHVVLANDLNNSGRGFNLVVLRVQDDSHSHRWHVDRVARFDTYESDSTELEMFLERVRVDEVLIVLASDEASRKLSEHARSLLADFGAAQVQNLHFRDVYLLIGQRASAQERLKVQVAVRSSERNDTNVTHIVTDFVALEELEFAGRGASWPKPIDRLVCLPPRGRLARFHVRPEPSLNKFDEHRAFCERYAVRYRAQNAHSLPSAFQADSAMDRFANSDFAFPLHADYTFSQEATQELAYEYPYADFCDAERFAEPLVPLAQLDYALQLGGLSASVPRATVAPSGVAFSTELFRVPVVLVVDARRPEVARLTLDSLFAQAGLLIDRVHVFYVSRSSADEQLVRLLQLYRVHAHSVDAKLLANVDGQVQSAVDLNVALQTWLLESAWNETFAATSDSLLFVHEGIVLSPDCFRLLAHLYDAFAHDASVGLAHAWTLHGLKRFAHNAKLVYRVRQYVGLVYLARRSWASWWTSTEFYRQNVRYRSTFEALGAMTRLGANEELAYDSFLPECSRAYYVLNANVDAKLKQESVGQKLMDYVFSNEPQVHVSGELLAGNTQQFSSVELLFENETSLLSPADTYLSALQTVLLDSNTDVIFLGKLKTSQARGESNNLAELLSKAVREDSVNVRTVAVFVSFASQLDTLFASLCRGSATRLCYLSRAAMFADSVVRFSLKSHLHFLLVDTSSALCDSYVTLSKSAFVCD